MSFKPLQILVLLFVALLLAGESYAQETKKPGAPKKVKKINFGYSINPPIRKAKSAGKKPVSDNSKEPKKSTKTVKSAANTGAKKPIGKTKGKPEEVVAGAKTPKGTNTDEVGKVDSKETANGSNPLKSGSVMTSIDSENADSATIEKIDVNIDERDGDSRVLSKKADELTLARKTREIAKRAVNSNLSPMEIYRVGVDDVLFISLQNSKSSASKYYTILNDGTIDYPLAGGMISVMGLTSDEVEDVLREKIKLYENPQVSVRVREHASHKISVLGLVEKPGDKFLQREAMPLYIIKAEAVVRSEADKVTIRRKGLVPETFLLADDQRQGYLIYPGDVVEFGSRDADQKAKGARGFIYMGTFVIEAGKQEYSDGITLTQAILTSGGLRSGKTKKVVVRRKNPKGMLETKVYNLRKIKQGKAPDPTLEPGDIVEKG